MSVIDEPMRLLGADPGPWPTSGVVSSTQLQLPAVTAASLRRALQGGATVPDILNRATELIDQLKTTEEGSAVAAVAAPLKPIDTATLVDKVCAAVREEMRKHNSHVPGKPETWPEKMTPEQAADYCQVSEATLRNWRKRGLKCEVRGRVVRYRKAELDAHMQGTQISVDAAFAAIVRGA